MTTVPRPERTPEQRDADQMRELLAAIADVLDVPMDAAGSLAARDRLISDRAVAVRTVTQACSGSVLPTDPAKWLRDSVALLAPLPEDGAQ